jgi:uncharacterized protein (TIGR03437 family)
VKTFFAIVLTLGLLAVSGFAQPTVSIILNAASSSYPPLQNSSIAQGSYFTIYGTGIGPATGVGWNPYPLPTTLGGTSVSVTVPAGATTSYPAYPSYVSATQINAVLNSNTPVGTGTLTVTYNGTASATFPITVVKSSFGTFAWNEVGSGPGIFTNAQTNALLTPFTTIEPGQYVTIWGTGLGAAPNLSTEQSAPPPQTNLCPSGSSCPVTVWVGTQQATVLYAGRSGFTAEDQIDFQVPPGTQGCYVQVAVEINSIISNFTSLPVDPNGATCQDADGVNYNDIASLIKSNGHANVGAISLFSDYLNVSTSIGSGQWDNDTVSGDFITLTQGAAQSFEGVTRLPSVNNCTVNTFLQFPPPPDSALGGVAFLSSGANLTIKGPSGATATVAQNTNDSYGAQPAGNLTTKIGLVGGVTVGELATELASGTCPSTATDNCVPFFLSTSYGINSGQYTVTSPGGAVGAISAAIDVTPAAASFKWTNQSSVTAGPIARTAPLEIDWSGGDSNGYVDITAIASTLQTGIEPAATTPGVIVECVAPASTGKFIIPAFVLESLPNTTGSTALVPPGELLVGPASVACSSTSSNPTSSTCPAQLTTPSGLDALYIFYHFILGQNVAWE